MADIKGKTVTIKIGDGADPEVFSAVCGVKEKSFSINNQQVDTTKPDCTDPTKILAYEGEFGVRTVTLSGSGLAQAGSASFTAFKDAALNQTKPNLEINIPNFQKYRGSSLITSFSLTGPMDNNVAFDFEVTMSGEIEELAAD